MKRIFLALMLVISMASVQNLASYEREIGAAILNGLCFAKNGFKFDTKTKAGLALTGLALIYRRISRDADHTRDDRYKANNFADFACVMALLVPLCSEIINLK